MVKLLTRPTEPDLSRVEADLEVVAARERHDGLAVQLKRLQEEDRQLALLLNPNTSSVDHRPFLDAQQILEAEDRRKEIAPLRRRLPVELQAAESALLLARARAQTARFAACRARVAGRLTRFYEDIERVAAGSHRELVDEIVAMNALLGVPGISPAFPLDALAWPELREGSLLAHRRRGLVADGWLADE